MTLPPTMSPRAAAAYVMADEMTRAGLQMSEFDRAQLAERLLEAVNRSGLHLVEKPTYEPKPAPIPAINASQPVTLAQLIPGRPVYRYTEPVRRGKVRTELPCCARRVTIPAEEYQEVEVVCQFDLLRYTLTLLGDADGGFWANFMVAADELVVAQRRTPGKG